MRYQRAVLLILCLLLTTAGLAQDASLKTARAQLERGRPDLALKTLERDDLLSQVIRFETLCELGEYTQARDLLTALEGEAHSQLPPPYDFRFYLYRGMFQQAAGEFSLARKNFSEARRRARRKADLLEVQMREVELWLDQEERERVDEAYAQTAELISQVEQVHLLVAHLELTGRVLSRRGNLAAALSCNRAARELCLANSLPSRAADSLLYRLRLHKGLDYERRLVTLEQAIGEYLDCGNYGAVVPCLDQMQFVYFGRAESEPKIGALFEQALAEIPEGPTREWALLSWANYRLDTGDDTPALRELYEKLKGSSSPEIRCLAQMGIALWTGGQGDRGGSVEEFRKALALASPQMKRDRQWRTAPGAILLRMAYQEKARHRLQEALDLGRQGVALQTGADWRLWRVQARYETLMAAVESFDVEAAEEEFQASLEDIEKLPVLREQVGSLTTILASLLLNRSVEGDVLDPCAALLGDYSELAVHLLDGTFGTGGASDAYLALFDQWQDELARQKEAKLRSFPLVYKGLFLEALGRLAEAEVALRSGLDLALEGETRQSQILARVLLARIHTLRGESQAAAEEATLAAEVSQKLNPLAARFYALVAGGVQRRAGQWEQALQSFDRAIAYKPEKAWPGLYGRALTLEAMGRPGEALTDTEKALEMVSGSERGQSTAEIQALRARLLVRLGRPTEARKLFGEAHPVLLSSPLCARVTSEYGTLLESLGKRAEALELYTSTLDHLVVSRPSSEPQLRTLFEQSVSLALKMGENGTALKYLELSRSVELIDSVDLSRVAVEDRETQALLPELKKLRIRLGRLQEESGKADSRVAREALGQQLAATRGEFFARLNQLREREPDFERLVQVSGSQLSALQQMLPQGTALVEYFPAPSTLYLFLVTSDSFSLHQVSLPRADLEARCQKLVQLCTTPQASTAEVVEVSRFLHTALIEVAGEEFKGVDHLLLVPSGPLWEVPFAALLDQQGQPLSQRYSLSYLGSSELLKLFQGRPERKRPTALLVGGTAKLEGVRQELADLGSLFPQAAVLSPEKATVSAFRAALKGRSLVHIASHSHVSRKSGESYIEMGEEKLTLEQIYGFKMEPSSMVVLSSCRSGVGVAVPGKEVTSLATAFSVAGASTVLASRWQVDDRSTAEFFRAFYRALLGGASRAEALRQAQAEMARRKPHPYYWAAFHLLGDVR